MQSQLEQLEIDYSIEWQEYQIGDLFEVLTTVRRQLPCPVGDNYLDRLIDM